MTQVIVVPTQGTAISLGAQGLPLREYLLVGISAAVVTFLLTGVVRLLAIRFGAVAWPRGRDVHVTPTPRWGGLAIFAGILGGVAVAAQLPALRLAFLYSSEVVWAIVAAALLVVVGALDDRYELDAFTKLAGQITAAGLLVLKGGIQWSTFWVPWGGGPGHIGFPVSLSSEQSALITVLLTVALVNGMNFVDGLDGLAAGLGCIAATATCLFSLGLLYDNGNDPNAYSPALIAALLAGGCFGFLPHNFNPARLFMGDSGSMLIGVMLAAATITASGRITRFDGKDAVGLMTPLIVLAAVVFVPLLDLLMAVVRRTRAGTSPFSPDKMHLHHRLLEIGHSQRRAVLLAYLWSGVLAFGAVALSVSNNTALVLWGVGFMLLFAMLATAVPRLRTPGRVKTR
ncbi:glycosyltransferase family 4 protein [Pseudonocardia spinosispora]|uniref:glycosyltransferase family 4 protein n=1 Tax=Pseudonocardia spinosispora TaxID=103441 RepID=UPI000684E0FB|nr:MraY family glycosyltransferase [Pseudonocardia spinosispora]